MITVYGISLSTFTRKVRLALEEKGIEYRFEAARMGSKRVRALNPLGRIPVLEDGGAVIPDSSVIIAYLERAYPAQPLYPESTRDLAHALWMEEYADTHMREATVPFFAENVVKPLFQDESPDGKALAKAAPIRDECFDYLERECGAGNFFVGDRISVADLAIGAQLITYRQAAGDLARDRWPRLAAYLAGLMKRPRWEVLLAEEDAALDAARKRLAAGTDG